MAIIKNGVGGVGVHRALSNLSGRELILDADGDTSITADTDDQIDIRIGGSDLIVMAAAQTTFTQNILTANAAGPALVNEAATTTNPTLIPNQAELDTGIGWASDTLHVVLGGANKLAYSAASFAFQEATAISTTAGALNLTPTTIVGVNETANANMTIGVTINQAGNDNQAFCLKSSDVTSGLGDATQEDVETDDFFCISKASAAQGGALIQAMAEDASENVIMDFRSYGGTASTDKTVGGATALVNFFISEHDGSNGLSSITADGNIFGVWANVSGYKARLLVDEDGDLYSVTSAQTFDDWDDLALMNAYDTVRSDYTKWAVENEEVLLQSGILGAPVAEGGMTNVTQLQRVQVGAIRQLGAMLQDTTDRLVKAEKKLALLEA